MRTIHFLLIPFLALWLTISCDSEVADIHTLNGTWTLVAYENMLTRVLDPKPNDPNAWVTLTFIDDKKNGSLVGTSGPNQVSGAYSLNQDHELSISEYGGTKIAEIDWTAKSREAIPMANAYEISRERLYIYFDDQRERMIFVKN